MLLFLLEVQLFEFAVFQLSLYFHWNKKKPNNLGKTNGYSSKLSFQSIEHTQVLKVLELLNNFWLQKSEEQNCILPI